MSAQAATIARRWPVVSASVAVVLVVALGVLIAFRPNEPFAIDREWMGEIVEHRSPFWLVPALFFNYVGGGILGSVVIPVVIVLRAAGVPAALGSDVLRDRQRPVGGVRAAPQAHGGPGAAHGDPGARPTPVHSRRGIRRTPRRWWSCWRSSSRGSGCGSRASSRQC